MTPSPSGSNEALASAVRAWVSANYPGHAAECISIRISGLAVPAKLPLLAVNGSAPTPEPVFVPNTFQEAILEALEGKALRTDALAAKVGDRSRLFRHPGGLKELQAAGRVGHHPRLGYYSIEAPPEELADQE